MSYANVTSIEDGKRRPKLANTLAKLLDYEQAPNIAELLDEDVLKKLGHDTDREYDIDKNSRADWEESAGRAMDIALQVRQPKNYPFQGAANIKYPLVTVAALQFGARAYPAIIDGNRVVKGQVVGRDDGQPMTDQNGQPVLAPGPDGQPQPQWKIPPGAKRAKADRVSQHMSYQLLNEMEEWEEDTDVLLHHLPIVGCAFRKVWRSEELGRNKSEMIPAIHLVVNNRVRNLNEAPRVTHELYIYPQDIEERKLSGTFLDVDLPMPPNSEQEGNEGGDDDAPHLFLEQHRYEDLDGDGYREPYIVTVHKDSCQVVRIVANFRMEKIKHDETRIQRIPKEQYFVKYSFIPDPKGGFYDIGFGKLLESLGETIDTTINQMLDAGHLQNAGGGLIGTGVRFKKNKIAVSPGKYEQVEVNGDIRQQLYTHQWPGPSPVLFNLLGMMVEAARDITAVKDILTGDTGDKGVQTATTTLALIEQGLKVFTAIYKRVYRAMKDEFKLLFDLNLRFMDQEEYFTILDQPQAVAKSDYDSASMDIIPVADPKMVTDMQRSARANVYMQISASPLGPAMNPQEALKRLLESIGEDQPEKLITQQQGPSPEQQLALANMQAEVEQKQSDAKLKDATAAKTEAEMHLMPAKFEHDGTMAENMAKREAERIALEKEKIAAAERGEERNIAAKDRSEGRKLRADAMAGGTIKVKEGESLDDDGEVKISDHVQKLVDANNQLAAKSSDSINQLLKVMAAPIAIERDANGKATGASRRITH